MLRQYEWIVERYGPYVLIRSAAFTNCRTEAARIAAYTLVTTCLLAGELDHPGQLGILVDTMADVVAEDADGGPVQWRGRLRADDDPLLTDERMRALAEALNRLERPEREALVLHHVCLIELGALEEWLCRPAARIAAEVAAGEQALAEQLDGLCPGDDAGGEARVRSLLAEFAATLDAAWLEEVQACALSYLARHDRRSRLPDRWACN